MTIVALVVIALVILSLISLFLLAFRRKSWWLVCVGLLIVALLTRLVWTSGIRSEDWVQGIIYSEGEDTVVVVDGCEIVLEKMPWRMNDLDFDMQVAGWTTSASEPSSGVGTNVYVHYLGGGESEIIVNQRRLRLRKAGTEILIGNEFIPLNQVGVFGFDPRRQNETTSIRSDRASRPCRWRYRFRGRDGESRLRHEGLHGELRCR